MKRIVCWMGLVLFSTSALLAEDIRLPEPRRSGGMPLMEALAQRRTERDFSSEPLPPQMLSDLLWASFGINRPDGKRTAPSARNMQEIDIYVALPEGLYLYDPAENKLTHVLDDDLREQVGRQPFTQRAPVGLIFVADESRMRGDKAFYAAVDTGYISQNTYLFCASEGLHTVALGMVDKPLLHRLMGLREDQKIILTQPVGFPPTGP